MNYTPKPWKTVCTGRGWYDPKFEDIEILENIEIQHSENRECICDTVYKMENAILMTAAPDMLEALEAADRLLTWMESGRQHKEPEPRPIKKQIENAIAKARGE